MTFVDILNRLGDVTKEGRSYRAHCPAHNDVEHPSLTVSLKDDGTVLFRCWSGHCSFTEIIEAIGIEQADCFNVEPGGDVVTTSASASAAPPTAEQVQWLRGFIDQCAAAYAGSPAARYAEDRWGITETQAKRLQLGFTDTAVEGDFVPYYKWNSVDRIVVPMIGFDGVPRGAQGRALGDDPTRWCSLSNPAENAWSRIGYLTHDHGEAYCQLGEGPGDGLTAWAAGIPAAFVRGTSMAEGVINTIVAGLRDHVVILAGDADGAGQLFNRTVGEALTDAGLDVRVLVLPDGAGDVTEWREANPTAFPREYAVALREAIPFVPAPPLPPPPPSSGRSFMNTIDGNAARLIEFMGGDLSFCPQIGRMVYGDGVWCHDELNVVVHRMSALTYQMLAEGQDLEDEGAATGNGTLIERGEALKGWAVRSQNHVFDDSIRRAEQMSSIPVAQLDAHKHLLNFANVTVDLRTGTTHDHDRDDWLTHRLPFDYDDEAECPRWLQFLDEVFPDKPEVVPWLQRLFGYSATGETIEQCLLMCVGKGANGKSVMLNTLGHVLEPLTCVLPFASFEKKGPNASTADLASLRGKRLCLVQEGEANTTLAESTVKRATGGDRLSARNLYRSQMSFEVEALIVMASNSVPIIRGADEGIWRRVRMLLFNRFFTDDERDPYLTYTLREEAAGIARWMVEGARLWYASGLGDPATVKEATLDFRYTSDELSGFIGMVIVPDDEGSVLGADLMGQYLDWCVEENIRAWSRRALYAAVVERIPGARKVKRKNGIHLLGLRLATDDDRAAMAERGDDDGTEAFS